MLSSLDLALKLSRQRNVRPPQRFSVTEMQTKSAARKPTCPCGAKSEPSSSHRFKWCDKCRVFVSVGGLVRCMCGLAMPPNIDNENGANDANDDDDGEMDGDLIDWIQCDRCKHFLHVSCVFGPLAAASQLSQQAFVCALCDDDDNAAAAAAAAAATEPVGTKVAVAANDNDVVEVDDEEDGDGADDQSAPKRHYLCGVDGCDFFCRRIKGIHSHRDCLHRDRVIDNSVPPAVVKLSPDTKVTCRFCGLKTRKQTVSLHAAACKKKQQHERQPAADDTLAPPQPAQKRARTTSAAIAPSDVVERTAASTVSAFPESAVRVLGSAADGALEKARRGVLLRKIRALIELDEAFLQTMDARYSTHKLTSGVQSNNNK
jgi:hypothetical protein